MKKVAVLLLVLLASLATVFGCSRGSEYVALQAADAQNEAFGFCVSKKNPKWEEILATMNAVIDDFKEEKNGKAALLDLLIEYHEAMSNDNVTDKPADPYTPPASTTENGTLVVYTNAEFAPYEYVSGNEVVGVDMDMMMEVAARLKMGFEVQNVAFNSVVAGVAGGSSGTRYYVGAAGITITVERKEQVEFSKAYIGSVQYIISTKDKSYTKIEDLKGLKIAVQEGTTGDKIITAALEGELQTGEDADPTVGCLKGTKASISRLASGPAAFAALKSGAVDVIVIDQLPALSIIANQ